MQDLSQEAVDQKNSGKSRDRFRVFVIDDSALVRDGIRSLLSSCATCEDVRGHWASLHSQV